MYYNYKYTNRFESLKPQLKIFESLNIKIIYIIKNFETIISMNRKNLNSKNMVNYKAVILICIL